MSLYISHIAQRDETLGTVGSQSVAQEDESDTACCNNNNNNKKNNNNEYILLYNNYDARGTQQCGMVTVI